VYELGAAYAVYIVQGHVFADGNKRTASAVMLEFLLANSARVTLSTTRIVQLTVELQQRAREGEGSGDLVRWLAAEIRPRKKARK
jgi:death-on-curing family protein